MIVCNDIKITPTIFPDKTSQVWKIDIVAIEEAISKKGNIHIKWDFESEGEIFQIYQLLHLLPKMGVTLECPYLPYARQDKDVSNDSCFALTTFCHMFEFIEELITFDAHNPSFFEDESIKFKFTNILPTDNVKAIIAEHSINAIVFPDKGAETRYGGLVNLPSYFASKVRDQLTGNITGLSMESMPPDGSCVLVFDDLIDGGKSFTEVAKLLLPLNPTKLILYISHGIFSKGKNIIFDAGYNYIYTKEGPVFYE
jgi:ribose-phosphate pyrophosphokinase